MRYALLTLAGVAFAFTALTFAIDMGWRETVRYADELERACVARSRESLVDEARAWIARYWTRSWRPFDRTALPDGTAPADIEDWGGNYERYNRAHIFYTQKTGGVAFFVAFDWMCDFGVEAQPCPNRVCEIARRRIVS